MPAWARLRFESALGSLYETEAGLRLSIAWGYVSAAEAGPALAAIDRLGGRIFGLCRHRAFEWHFATKSARLKLGRL